MEQYKRESGKDVVITLDTENFLPADSTGGVELYALQGRIRVSFNYNFIILIEIYE